MNTQRTDGGSVTEGLPKLKPWEKRAADAIAVIRRGAEARGFVYSPAGSKRLSPLEYDLAREDNCPHHTVYFLYAAGRIKIGFTSGNVQRREEAIANGCPVPVWLVKTVPGGKITEFKIHHQFKDARVYGEWFELTPELRSFLKEGAQNATALSSAETEYRLWLQHERSKHD